MNRSCRLWEPNDLITIIGMAPSGLKQCICRLMLLALVGASVQAEAAQSQGSAPTGEFSEAVVTGLLEQVRQGLETNNQDQMLSAFDPEKMRDYPAFRDQVRGLLENYESIQARYNIGQVWTDGATGVALVEFEMESVPRADNAPPRHNSAQLRFEFRKSAGGWKIVALTPREFFS